MATIASNIQQVHQRITQACALSQRPVRSVTLLSVTKTFGPDAVREAFAAGERRFGENYVQEGVDKIAALAEQRPAHLAPLQLCLQVNISGEASKSGLAPDEVAEVARQVAALPQLRLRGLMAIPEPAGDLEAQRAPHRALRQLLEQLNAGGLALDTLSMGMSADMDAAIAEGATMVRVGSAIFGTR